MKNILFVVLVIVGFRGFSQNSPEQISDSTNLYLNSLKEHLIYLKGVTTGESEVFVQRDVIVQRISFKTGRV